MKIGYDLEKTSEQKRLERDGYIIAALFLPLAYFTSNLYWLVGTPVIACLAFENRYLRNLKTTLGDME